MSVLELVFNVLLFAGSVGLLVLGSDWLVRGASRLAAAMGISPLVVGLTVVAFGTSAPEFAVSIAAALSGQGDMALGNVVGSNICNVLLILGLTALVLPLAIDRQIIRLDAPLMVVATLAVVVTAYDGVVSRRDGLALFTALVAYLAMLVWMSSRSPKQAVELTEPGPAQGPKGGNAAANLGLVVVGLVMLVGGGQGLVTASVAFARALGMSELVIGLTIVAVGTSMPEIATSLVAAWRGERDIAVGNVVGSNIFNALGVLGATAMVSASGVGVAPSALMFDLPVMVAVTLLCLPVFRSHGEISRAEGALLLMCYGAYTLELILMSTNSVLARPVGLGLMLGFVPLVLVFVLLSTGHDIRQRGRPARK